MNDARRSARHGAVSLADALAGKRLIVLVGEGGVGKTSTSAALAYGRASRGESVAVLTIDPAPRLGDALGIASIDSEPRNVALPATDGRTHGRKQGSLTAMRLDSKHTFDRMIKRHASSAAAASALLANPIYRAISGQLGGTENYMAFQRLHELVDSGGHDCLVLDTPPAANAAELLAAPARLTGLLETGALSVLADPSRMLRRVGAAMLPGDGMVSRAGSAMASAGAMMARATVSLLLAAIERVTGASLVKDVSEFASMFGELVGGLEGRARDIDALLRSPQTAFVLVTRPRVRDVDDALAFRDGLARMGIDVAAVLVNRVTPRPSATQDLQSLPAHLPAHLHAAVERMEADMNKLHAMESDALARLRAGLADAKDPPLFTAPARDVDIASLDDIAALAEELAR